MPTFVPASTPAMGSPIRSAMVLAVGWPLGHAKVPAMVLAMERKVGEPTAVGAAMQAPIMTAGAPPFLPAIVPASEAAMESPTRSGVDNPRSSSSPSSISSTNPIRLCVITLQGGMVKLPWVSQLKRLRGSPLEMMITLTTPLAMTIRALTVSPPSPKVMQGLGLGHLCHMPIRNPSASGRAAASGVVACQVGS